MDIPESPYGPEEANPEEEKAKLQQATKDDRDMDALIAKTFSTPAGQRVLEWLHDETIGKPVFRKIGQDLAGSHEGYFREGQNELVRQLKARIKRSQKNK